VVVVRQRLQIYDARERLLVRAADALISPLRWWPRAAPPREVRRVLLLRLERIGDLLMTLDAIREARQAWPTATIDLAVGRWNGPLAALIPDVSEVLIADVPWLARGDADATWPTLLATAQAWHSRHYDVVVNFEPDIRSNLLAWLTRAPVRVGYDSGGGGAWLTNEAPYDPSTHVAENASRLIARASGVTPRPATSASGARLTVPASARDAARAWLGQAAGPIVGIHASGGRESKQWHLDRFAAVGRALAASRGATIVLTGSAADRTLVENVAHQMPGVPVRSAAGAVDLVGLAALLAELDVLVTGDTGPMHLAAAVGTPVVALFGPSDPVRYGPRAAHERIIRIDLPCSPCGQVRLPPVRCRGHVPDCLDGIGVDLVVTRALELLDAAPVARARRG
jgi:lipopolysaccharide heptosyltransferase II